MDTQTVQPVRQPPFGSVLTEVMALAWFREGQWTPAQIVPTAALPIHPAAHALHYGSSCFEGFKAYRRADGEVHIFRLQRHIERMRQSARALVLPEPDPQHLADMVRALVSRCRADVPEAPGSLYLRPLLFGSMANIGAAGVPSSEACLVVLASPVWDYFAGGMKPLRIAIELNYRTAPHLGMVKTGGNYAAALGPTLAAKREWRADQVLFCPGGQVQETGAANFVLIRDGALLTRSLDSSFLHGVTRDSLLVLARDLGYSVSERAFDLAEMLEWIADGEAALSGTAAVLAGVGTLIHEGREYRVGTGDVGPHTRALRAALIAIQRGDTPDRFGWLTRV
ncbi:MAG TPA: branched-chain amino acid aminotransferase [Steroidobacteraceae bacterium]|nr:branched-chain amino acid aminotransferase [Steroidobacteraceae bacterium]